MQLRIISIAILVLEACSASIQAPPPEPASMPAPEHDRYSIAPDGKGLYISLDDAYAEVVDRENERRRNKVTIIRLQGERDSALAREKLADDSYQKEKATASSWLSRWGLPLGLAGGFLTGIIATFLVARSVSK